MEKEKTTMTLYLACAIAEGFCEGEGATEEEQIEAWQYLHDTGKAYTLQGWYGRTAANLLAEGIIKWRNWYGNYITKIE